MEVKHVNNKFSELIIPLGPVRLLFMNRLISRRGHRWFGYHGILTHIQKRNADGTYINWIWFRVPYKKFKAVQPT